MKEKRNFLITFYYGQPFAIIFTLVLFFTGVILFIFQNPYNMIFMFDTIFVAIAYFIQLRRPKKINNGLKIFYIHKHMFLRNRAVINQRSKGFNTEAYDCPNKQVKEELEIIVNGMQEGSVYTFTTHNAVISLLAKTEAVQGGRVSLMKLPYYSYMDLARIKRNIQNSHCKDCNNEHCGTTYNCAEKDKERFYAVKLVCTR